MKNVLIIILLVFPLLGKAQGNSEKFNRFSADFKIGTAIPVGAFEKNSTSNLIGQDPNANEGRVIGVFTKEGNGFAKPGFTWSGEVTYRFAKAFFGGLMYQNASNPVDLEAANDYLRTLDSRVTMRQDDYHATFLAPMIGYQTAFGKFDFRISQAIGKSELGFPYFEMEFDAPPPNIFRHLYDTQPISSWFSKTEVQTSYRLNNFLHVGVHLSYLYSNFDYNLALVMSPGGSGEFRTADTVNLRLLNLGLHIGVEF
jgi:hypothetical protein